MLLRAFSSVQRDAPTEPLPYASRPYLRKLPIMSIGGKDGDPPFITCETTKVAPSSWGMPGSHSPSSKRHPVLLPFSVKGSCNL